MTYRVLIKRPRQGIGRRRRLSTNLGKARIMAAQPAMTTPTMIKPKTRRSFRVEIRGDERTKTEELPRTQRLTKLLPQRITRQTMPAVAKIDPNSRRARAHQASSAVVDGAAAGPRLPLQGVARRIKVIPEARSLQIRRRKMHLTQTSAKAVDGAAASETVAANKTMPITTIKLQTHLHKLATNHQRRVGATPRTSR